MSQFRESLRGKAARYYNQRVYSWWKMTPTPGSIIDKMSDSYRIGFSKQQAIKLFAERKDKSWSRNDRLLSLGSLQKVANSGE